MICAACGTESTAGAKFCVECGAPQQAPLCTGCGAPAAGGKFCPECGTPTTRAGASTAVPLQARTAERRMTSVLFGDLVGFTTLSESRDAEEVRELLSRYFEQ